jgi:hypothetical protein
MRFINRVDKWQAHMSELEFKLRQDGVTEGFCGDTRAVRDKEYGWIWHGELFFLKAGLANYNGKIIRI